jgi:hypothetical protein
MENKKISKEAEIKALQKQLADKDRAIVALEQKHNKTVNKSLVVFEENRVLKASTDVTNEIARMEHELKVADYFIQSGAFKAQNAAQAYVIIKAGREMGLEPVESMQALYLVNGGVKYYGDKMIAQITKRGFRVEYKNETPDEVTVRIFHPETGFDVSERVTSSDQILQKSNAVKFAKKHKMRFHGVRIIASFHLPHLFGSTIDEFTPEFNEWQDSQPKGLKAVAEDKEAKRVLDYIAQCKTIEDLKEVNNDVKGRDDLLEDYILKYIELSPTVLVLKAVIEAIRNNDKLIEAYDRKLDELMYYAENEKNEK